MQRRVLLLFLLGMFSLAACTGGTAQPTQTPQAAINWTRTPETILVRLDRVIRGDPPYLDLNRLPPCTLYGNGRVVWVNTIPPNGEEILEAVVNDVAIRTFLEFIIRDQKFYSTPDYASQELPATENAVMESITLNVNQELRTIRSYRPWPANLYQAILERCRKLTDRPALVAPKGAWISAYEFADTTNYPRIYWPASAPFKLADVAQSGKALWATGAALNQLWNNTRSALGQILWLEGEKAYRVAIQVPLVSRDSPPAPKQ